MSIDFEHAWKVMLSVATYAGIGAFIDFYLGKAGQRRVKSALETWWIAISYVQARSFAKDEATVALRAFDSLFGGRLLSAKRVAAALWVGISCFLVGVALPALLHMRCPEGVQAPTAGAGLTFYAIFTVSSVLFFALSISITRLAIRIATCGLVHSMITNLLLLVTLTCLQSLIYVYSHWLLREAKLIVANFCYLWLSTPLFDAIAIAWSRGFQGGLQSYFTIDMLSRSLYSLPEEFPTYECVGHSFGREDIRGAALLELVPTLLRFALTMLFIVSYFLRPLKKFVLATLDRLVASDKPAFTLLFGFVGAVAALSAKL